MKTLISLLGIAGLFILAAAGADGSGTSASESCSVSLSLSASEELSTSYRKSS